MQHARVCNPTSLLERCGREERIADMSAPMARRDGEDRMLQRNAIVMRIMAIQSEELRCDTERCALEIERLNAQSNFEDGKLSREEEREKIASLQDRAVLLDQKHEAHQEEQKSLYQALSEIDNGRAEPSGPVTN